MLGTKRPKTEGGGMLGTMESSQSLCLTPSLSLWPVGIGCPTGARCGGNRLPKTVSYLLHVVRRAPSFAHPSSHTPPYGLAYGLVRPLPQSSSDGHTG